MKIKKKLSSLFLFLTERLFGLLINSLKYFQSDNNLDTQYIFNLILHSSFYYALEHLVILIDLEYLFQRDFKMITYF